MVTSINCVMIADKMEKNGDMDVSEPAESKGACDYHQIVTSCSFVYLSYWLQCVMLFETRLWYFLTSSSAGSTPWWTHFWCPCLARSLLFFVVDSVCQSVTNIDSSFLFLSGIEPFLGHQFSMTKTTKRCSSIFDLGPLTPKIYSPKLPAIMLHYHVATRGRALSTSALPRESWQSTELRGQPLLPWQRNLG